MIFKSCYVVWSESGSRHPTYIYSTGARDWRKDNIIMKIRYHKSHEYRRIYSSDVDLGKTRDLILQTKCTDLYRVMEPFCL